MNPAERDLIDWYCRNPIPEMLADSKGGPWRPSDFNIHSIIDRIVSEGAVEDYDRCVPRYEKTACDGVSRKEIG